MDAEPAGLSLSPVRRWSLPSLLVWAAMLVYSLYFSALSLARHAAYQTQSYDLSFYAQALWNTLHGDFLRVTFQPGVANYLQLHFAPGLLLFAPLYAIWPAPELLLILQALILASAAWPVYCLAGAALRSDWLGLVFALAYLLYPALHAANLYDFHEITIAAPLLAWAWYFARRRRWAGFALFCLLGLSFREEALLFVLGMGGLLALRRETRKPGLLALAGGLGWLLLVLAVAFWQGSVAMSNAIHFRNRFELGESPAAALRTLLGRPLLAWQRWTEPAKLHYFANMYAPTGFLALFSLENVFLVLPALAMYGLSVYAPMYSAAQAQYNVLLAPFMVISAAAGSAWLVERLERRLKFKRAFWLKLISGYVLLLSFAIQLQLPFLPYSPFFAWPRPEPRQSTAQALARLIPADASLSVYDTLAPHLSNRRELYVFPQLEDAGYVFLDLQALESLRQAGLLDLSGEVQALRSGGRYEILQEQQGYLLLRRVGLEAEK